jgi:hypothetical protein
VKRLVNPGPSYSEQLVDVRDHRCRGPFCYECGEWLPKGGEVRPALIVRQMTASEKAEQRKAAVAAVRRFEA